MKTKIAPIMLIAIFVMAQLLINCSNPLEDSESISPNPNPGIDTIFMIDTIEVIDTVSFSDTVFVFDTVGYADTVLVFDTLSIIDTLLIIDTLTNIDTLIFVDTISIVDTVTIIETDSIQTQIICGKLGWFRKNLVWMLRNDEGNFKLEFVASTDKDRPIQNLVVNIDNAEFMWKPQENPEIELHRSLEENTTITIKTTNPCAFGHTIDICLTITRE